MFIKKIHFCKKSYKIQAWSGYRRARRGVFFLKNSTCLRNIVYFVCFKNINASCLRGGRRNLPNCPGTSPIAPRKKYPVRVNPSLRFIPALTSGNLPLFPEHTVTVSSMSDIGCQIIRICIAQPRLIGVRGIYRNLLIFIYFYANFP